MWSQRGGVRWSPAGEMVDLAPKITTRADGTMPWVYEGVECTAARLCPPGVRRPTPGLEAVEDSARRSCPGPTTMLDLTYTGRG